VIRIGDFSRFSRVSVKTLRSYVEMGLLKPVAKWIDQNGYQTVGPGRELNLRLPEKQGDQNAPNTDNEIQFPVEKVT
jgi:hypothetical protein